MTDLKSCDRPQVTSLILAIITSQSNVTFSRASGIAKQVHVNGEETFDEVLPDVTETAYIEVQI